MVFIDNIREIVVMRRKLAVLALVAAGAIQLSYGQDGGKQLTIDSITNGTFAAKSAGAGFRPMEDGAHYSVVSRDHRAVLKCSYSTGKVVDTLFYTKTARECEFETFDDYVIAPNGLQILLFKDTEYIYRRSRKFNAYRYDVRRNLVQPLSASGGKVRIPTLSPDGRMCAFVKEDNNIYVAKFDYNTESAVTTDGKPNAILNGTTDWVYEEELYATNLMQWADSSEQLIFVRTDESKVPVYNMQMFGSGLYPEDYRYKYPKPGERNAEISLRSFDIRSKKTEVIELPIRGEYYIPRLDYAHGALQVFTFNRNQTHFRLFTVNPKSGLSKLLLEEKSERYIDPEWARQLAYTPNGFTYVNDKSGYNQLYLYSKQGAVQKKISRDNADVTAFYGVSDQGEAIYAMAYPTPMDRIIVATNLKNGKSRTLSPEKGNSRAVFSKDMSYYLLTSSNMETPARYSLNRTKDAKEMVLLEDNAALLSKMKEYSFAQKRFFQVTTASGVTLNGYIITPKNMEPGKKYPALFTQYSGPGSQEVQNRFKFDWEYVLPENGYVVVSLDGRGTGGRGAEFQKCTYLNLGLLESQDQCEGATATAKLFPYIDEERMAIWGWSFGGYTTLMAMSHTSPVFKAGIAIAPPTSWRLYDTTYTERFMRTPQENNSGYDRTSVMTRAANHSGNLLIIHGSADDNVHVQNTMQYVEALVQEDKYFEMLIYKDRNHSIYGENTRKHLYNSILRFLNRSL